MAPPMSQTMSNLEDYRLAMSTTDERIMHDPYSHTAILECSCRPRSCYRLTVATKAIAQFRPSTFPEVEQRRPRLELEWVTVGEDRAL